jgi:putative transposase
VNGRKRHLVVDTLGLGVTLQVHAADIADRDGAPLVLAGLNQRQPRLRHLWMDAGYRGPALRQWRATQPWTVTTVQRASRWQWVAPGEEPVPRPAGFEVLPRRWVVERTFAWLGRCRRLSKDYEGLPQTSVAWGYLALSVLMSRRLSGQNRPERRGGRDGPRLSPSTA